jgi:hypothetical protein
MKEGEKIRINIKTSTSHHDDPDNDNPSMTTTKVRRTTLTGQIGLLPPPSARRNDDGNSRDAPDESEWCDFEEAPSQEPNN